MLTSILADDRRKIFEHLPEGGTILEIAHTAEERRTDAEFHVEIAATADDGSDGLKLPLPFADESFDVIVLTEVLYRSRNVVDLLEELLRLLRPSGRIVMIEPGVSPVAWLVRSLFSSQSVNMNDDPLAPRTPHQRAGRRIENRAIPTLLFKRQENHIALKERIPDLRTVSVRWHGLFVYPLSMLLGRRIDLPERIVAPVLRLESRLMPYLGIWLTSRLIVALEKRPSR